ncbi:alpha/beta hydrolase [Paludibacterium denitrificans]|nr:alpha/beta hydrolase [Paludibacterium denitrificans]
MKISKLLLSIGLLSWLNATCAPALADTPLRSLLRERLAARQNASSNDGYGRFINHLSCEKLARLSQGKNRNGQSSSTPSQTASYGSHPAQKLELYLPEHTKTAAPIIIMVHGGAWCVGDMDAANVVNNKLAHWLPKGFIFVSANYRMLPDQADVLTRASDVARAIAYVQKHAADWHGDPSQIIVMGHSAGAHLVSLLSADPAMARTYGAQPGLAAFRWIAPHLMSRPPCRHSIRCSTTMPSVKTPSSGKKPRRCNALVKRHYLGLASAPLNARIPAHKPMLTVPPCAVMVAIAKYWKST